jgi:hypothetical protein
LFLFSVALVDLTIHLLNLHHLGKDEVAILGCFVAFLSGARLPPHLGRWSTQPSLVLEVLLLLLIERSLVPLEEGTLIHMMLAGRQHLIVLALRDTVSELGGRVIGMEACLLRKHLNVHLVEAINRGGQLFGGLLLLREE